MILPYRLTPEADQDLVDIWYYTYETWGIKQANSYLNQMEKHFIDLADQPGLGKKCDDIREGYRCFHADHHLIFYRQNKKDQIEVVRLLHERMNIPNYF